MSAIVSIDPGGVHCGMALFEEQDGEWTCVRAWEETPDGCTDQIVDWLTDGVTHIVVEEFRLYPWVAEQQSFKTFPEVEVIGVIKWLVRACAEEGLDCQIVMQGAAIKEPATKILKSKKVPSRSKRDGAGGHAKDAELHGWYYILKELGGRPAEAKGNK